LALVAFGLLVAHCSTSSAEAPRCPETCTSFAGIWENLQQLQTDACRYASCTLTQQGCELTIDCAASVGAGTSALTTAALAIHASACVQGDVNAFDAQDGNPCVFVLTEPAIQGRCKNCPFVLSRQAPPDAGAGDAAPDTAR
jgi:hypothetical protein